MITYPSILGPRNAPKEQCLAFHKYDGMNVRVQWSKKRGFYKYGSRDRLFDSSDKEFRGVIPLLQDKYAENLERIFTCNKLLCKSKSIVAFFEFYTENSLGGILVPDEERRLVLIDVYVLDSGMVAPKEFHKIFESVGISEVVYDGKFSNQFIQDVRDGRYPVKEGIVAKGVSPAKKHGHWMAKVKTKRWLEQIKTRAAYSERYSKLLAENNSEQM